MRKVGEKNIQGLPLLRLLSRLVFVVVILLGRFRLEVLYLIRHRAHLLRLALLAVGGGIHHDTLTCQRRHIKAVLIGHQDHLTAHNLTNHTASRSVQEADSISNLHHVSIIFSQGLRMKTSGCPTHGNHDGRTFLGSPTTCPPDVAPARPPPFRGTL